MKKLLPVLILTFIVWGCAKKMTPTAAESPASNTGSVINNKTQDASTNSSVINNTAGTTASNSAATAARTIPADATTEVSAEIVGQSTFNAKCGRCHGLKVTSEYTVERWSSILAVCAPRANLSDAERANVFAYVRANAKK